MDLFPFDAGPLLGMLPPSFEWTEPELPGYPLSGVHRGASGLAQGLLAPLAELLDGLTFELREVVAEGDREVVLGAQSYLETWYAGFGFVRDGDDYLDDGIPHLPMRLRRGSASAPSPT